MIRTLINKMYNNEEVTLEEKIQCSIILDIYLMKKKQIKSLNYIA